MDALSQLQALGLTMPSPAYLIGMLLFSVLGMAAYIGGKRRERPTTKWLGVALMFFPYAVTVPWLLYLVGGALCAAVWWDWKQA